MVLPITVSVVALIFAESRKKAITSGLFIAAGLAGGYVIVQWLVRFILPPLGRGGQLLFHSHIVALDIGWPFSAILAFGTVIGVLAFPVGLATNAIMLITRVTRTLDIDLWNFWHIAFVGLIVTLVTGSILEGLIAESGVMAITLFLADISQPVVRKYFGYDALSFPALVSLPYFVLAVILKQFFSTQTFFSDSSLPLKTFIEKRIQAFSSENFVVIGFIATIVVGVIGGIGIEQSVFIGIAGASTIIILPRVVALVVEGMHPVVDALSPLMQKHVGQHKLHMGMDSALLVGDPVNIMASSLLVPVTFLLAIILPGNHTFPLFDIPTIPFIIALMVPVFDGNLFYTVIGGIVAMVPTLYISTAMAPIYTVATKLAGVHLPGDGVMLTSLVDGGNPIVWVIKELAQLRVVGFVIALGVILVFLGVIRERLTINES